MQVLRKKFPHGNKTVRKIKGVQEAIHLTKFQPPDFGNYRISQSIEGALPLNGAKQRRPAQHHIEQIFHDARQVPPLQFRGILRWGETESQQWDSVSKNNPSPKKRREILVTIASYVILKIAFN